MKLSKVALIGLLGTIILDPSFSQERRGQRQGSGSMIVDTDVTSRRDENFECRRRNFRRQNFFVNQVNELQTRFCKYMSNKESLVDTWLDMDAEEDKLVVVSNALERGHQTKQNKQNRLHSLNSEVSELERNIPNLIRSKSGQEGSLSKTKKQIVNLKAAVESADKKLSPLRRDLSVKNKKRSDYFSSTFSPVKNKYDSLSSKKTQATTQLRNSTNSLSTNKRSLSTNLAQISRYESQVPRDKTLYESSMTRAGFKMKDKDCKKSVQKRQNCLERLKAHSRNMLFHKLGKLPKKAYDDGYQHIKKSLDVSKTERKALARAIDKYAASQVTLQNLKIATPKIKTLIENSEASKQKSEASLAKINREIQGVESDYNSKKSKHDGLASIASQAQKTLNTASRTLNEKKSSLRNAESLKVTTENKISNITGQIRSSQNLLAQNKSRAGAVKTELKLLNEQIETEKSKRLKIRETLTKLDNKAKKTTQNLKQMATFQTVGQFSNEHNTTHIFVGAFPQALNENGRRSNGSSNRGRDRYRRYEFNIKQAYRNAVSNGEKIFIWGDLRRSSLIESLTEKTGVVATEFQRRGKRSSQIIANTVSKGNYFTKYDNYRLTSLIVDNNSIPVVSTRTGNVVMNSKHLEGTDAIIFTSSMRISDMAAAELAQILDGIIKSPASDFMIPEPVVVDPVPPVVVYPDNPTPQPPVVVTPPSANVVSFSLKSPKVILSNSEIVEEFYVSAFSNQSIVDLNLTLGMTHTYMGDIVIHLVTPSGKTIVIRQNQGGSEDNLYQTYNMNNFSKELAGESAAGYWKLIVKDVAQGDEGSLDKVDFSLTLQ